MDSAKAVASGVSLCKDLVNSPPNMLTPGALADAAAKIAKDHGLECEILEVFTCNGLHFDPTSAVHVNHLLSLGVLEKTKIETFVSVRCTSRVA